MYGGALYLQQPYVHISRTRFENNDASVGHDIYVQSSSCFTGNEYGSLDSFVCSTTLDNGRLYCGNSNENKLQDCLGVVRFFFFFFFIYLF
jgi:hypothetical protein